jgi:hypothetical protein
MDIGREAGSHEDQGTEIQGVMRTKGQRYRGHEDLRTIGRKAGSHEDQGMQRYRES